MSFWHEIFAGEKTSLKVSNSNGYLSKTHLRHSSFWFSLRYCFAALSDILTFILRKDESNDPSASPPAA